MGERLKGDVPVKVGGGTYTFRFSGAALMALEEAFDGEAVGTLMPRLSAAGTASGGMKIADAARLVRAGLRRHHPDLSLDDAADLVLEPGVQDAMTRAIALAFPDAKGGDGDAAADPPKRRGGTGTKP